MVENPKSQVATASGLDVLAGIWLLISPFVLSFPGTTGATGNNVLFGIIIAVLAAIRAFGAYRASWISWLNALFGLWVLVSPWFLGFSSFTAPLWNNIIMGIIVIVLSCWSAFASESTTPTRRMPPPIPGAGPV